MGDVAIKLENVSKFYKLYNSPGDRLKEALNPFGKAYHKDFYAIKNISLEIKKGEILGIVGKNGCGKSTLLKLISGVLTPNKGKITVNGKISALLELGSGFNPEFTGMQNIFFYGTVLGLSKDDMDSKLDIILGFADIGDFIYQPLKTYSSGMKARLAFSVAVHVEPEILILDEVLSVGDMLFQRKCFAKMEELFDSGKTIIYVSHSLDSINALCTRAVLINQGAIVCSGKPKDVTAAYKKILYQGALASPAYVEEEVDNGGIKIGGKISDEFDHGLKTEIIVKDDNDYIKINDYHIVDADGKRVNVLQTNEQYSYVYSVTFKYVHKGVVFGAGIRSKQGVPLTWIINDNLSENIADNSCVKVKWGFTCRLLSGVYYTTAGVRDSHGNILRQELDTFVFKVERNHRNTQGGIFDSSWSCKVDSGEKCQ